MMSSVAGSSNYTEEETNPILNMQEERGMTDYLARTGGVCFSPCRPDVAVIGNAFDLMLLQSATDPLTASCSDPMFSFGINTLNPVLCQGTGSSNLKEGKGNGHTQTVLEITQLHGEPIQFPIRHQTIQAPSSEEHHHHHHIFMEERGSGTATATTKTTATTSGTDHRAHTPQPQHDAHTLGRLASYLKIGGNAARYVLQNVHDGEILAVAPLNIFLFSSNDRIMVVDVDGTITRSNIRGVVDTIVTEQYTYCHEGVCEFLSSMYGSGDNGSNGENGDSGSPSKGHVRLLYLTSRPIGIANTTRKFLSQLRQCADHTNTKNTNTTTTHYQLPQGPLMGHTGTLPQVLLMELVYHSIHEFKAQTLLKNVVQPFLKQGVVDPSQMFVAGFGNTLMDMQAYHMAGMDLAHIYLIDKQSNIYCLDNSDCDDPEAAAAAASKTLADPNHTEAEDNGSSHNNKTHPLKPRNEYLHMRGTHFYGYTDERLLHHVREHR
jgi:hypothetical protein